MNRVLFLGATGQVGQAFQAEPLPPDWTLGAFGSNDADITNHGAIQKLLRDFKPDIIINAAAMTNVDQCEREPDRATAINFEAVANLAAHCSVQDIPLIHLSTDYVFDGKDQTAPYSPDAQMSPLSVYADTKMMGEMAIRHDLAWHAILRVSSVFSAYGVNLLPRTLSMLAKNEEVKIVSDQTSCPTYAPDLARALMTITHHILQGKPRGFGTFHYCGAPAATRLHFVEAIMESFAPFTAKRPRILPALSADFSGYAERPAYSALDCTKTFDVFGTAQKPWQSGITEAIAHLHQQGKLPV